MKIYIFTPTYHRFEKTKTSLLSIKESIEHSSNEVKLFIGDNNSPREMVEWLRKTFRGDEFYLYESNKNLGKSRMVNKLWADCDKKCDVVVSIDSDMIADPSTNWIDTCSELIIKIKEFGLLATNQSGSCQHLWDRLEYTYKYDENTIKYNQYNGVAGGCVFLRRDDWEFIKGYVEGSLPVFGGSDAYLMFSISTLLRKECGVIENVTLFHPDSNNEEDYMDWKLKMSRQIRGEQLGLDPNKGFYDE